MNLWPRYLKEKFGWDTDETEHGFVSYYFDGQILHISEIYTLPEFRKRGVAHDFIADMEGKARDRGALLLRGKIWTKDPGATVTLKAALACGFSVSASENGAIIITKTIGTKK